MKDFPYKILMLTANIGKFGETDGVVTTYQNFIKELSELGIDVDIITYGPEKCSEKKGTVTIYTHDPKIPFNIDPKRKFDFIMFLSKHNFMPSLRDYDIIVSGTPDPLGFLGLSAAKRKKIPFLTFYHTSLDDYVDTRVKKKAVSISKNIIDYLQEVYLKFMKKFTLEDNPEDKVDTYMASLSKKLSKLSDKSGKIARSNMVGWLKAYFNKSNLILAPSEYTKKHVESIFEPKVSILGRGVDIDKFKPNNKNYKKPRAIYVGRITPEKNLELLVKIFFKLKNIDLEVVGNGDYLDEMKEKLPDAIYRGVLRGKELSEAYANADFFVFPSETDTFGNVVQEAFASGIPVVVTDKMGPKYIVHHGVTGFVATDDSEFEEYVKKLASNKKLRKKMGKAAREYAEQHTWKDITMKLLNYCEDLIEKNKK